MTQVQSILPGMRESAFNHFVKSFVRSAVSEITFFKSDNTPKDGVVFMRTETGALYACETIVILRPQHTSNSKQHNSNIKRGILLKDEDIEEDEDDKDRYVRISNLVKKLLIVIIIRLFHYREVIVFFNFFWHLFLSIVTNLPSSHV